MAIEVPDTRRSVDVGTSAPLTDDPARPASSGGFSSRRPVRRRPAAEPAADAAVGATAEPTGGAPAEPAPQPAPAPRRKTTAPRKRTARATPAEPPAEAPAPPVAAAAEPAPAPPEPEPGPEPAPDADDQRDLAPAVVQAVVIRLGGTRYALDMDAVGEVGRPPRVTRLPGVPEWVAGVANWRGRVLAVVDVRSLLLAATDELPASGRVVVLSRGGVTVGLLAERVDGVATIELARVEPALPTLASSAVGLVTGQLTDADGPIALLDPDAVLAMRDRLPRVRRVG
jgi:purine-binding chemotaxis protein CheW